jgi:hypothetical protein
MLLQEKEHIKQYQKRERNGTTGDTPIMDEGLGTTITSNTNRLLGSKAASQLLREILNSPAVEEAIIA